MTFLVEKMRMSGLIWAVILSILWLLQVRPFMHNGMQRSFEQCRADLSVPCGETLNNQEVLTRFVLPLQSSANTINGTLLVDNVDEFSVADRTFPSAADLTLP